MGGCQNYDPFLGTLNIRCRIIIGIQKGTMILTTTHMIAPVFGACLAHRVGSLTHLGLLLWNLIEVTLLGRPHKLYSIYIYTHYGNLL